jgi:hypothetical protein
MGPSFLWRRDQGYGYLTSHDRTVDFELFGTYDVFAPFPRLVVAVGASYRRFSGAGNSRTGTSNLTFSEHVLQAEVMPRFVLLPWLIPYGRLAGGLVTSRLQVDGYEAQALDMRDNASIITVGGGLTLRTQPRLFETRGGHLASLGFGVAADAGYTFASAAQFRSSASESHGLAVAPLSFGSLDRKAPYVRLMVVVRF